MKKIVKSIMSYGPPDDMRNEPLLYFRRGSFLILIKVKTKFGLADRKADCHAYI